MKRAKDTAKAVALENDSVETVEEWIVVRERRLGIFEGSYELCHAQLKVEEGIEDKELLTWRIPKGESLMDLSERIKKFLPQLIKQAEILPSSNSSILIVSHELFLKELHRVLSSFSDTGPLFGMAYVYYPNTGVSHYSICFASEKEDIYGVSGLCLWGT